MSKAGSTSEYDRTELEPLGQEVTAVEPSEEEQDPAEYAGQYAAHEPEWQCQVAAMKGQEFDMPGHCLRASLDSFQSARVDEAIASSRMK
ncbi:MAG: hypothetical protein IPK98_11320 [Chloracidobacterium sp.]|nr:hypothetical protein [Chloracidobacterium sp.]